MFASFFVSRVDSQLQVSIELLGLPIAVVQSSFLILASSFKNAIC
jgi:hypothetical protein